MIKLSAEKILNHYKTDLNITNKDRIIEDLKAQSLYILDFSERRERYIDRLEKKLRLNDKRHEQQRAILKKSAEEIRIK